jgi:hypothetical protein
MSIGQTYSCLGCGVICYPPALLRAAMDRFDYVLGLANGQVIRFEQAVIHDDYVTLQNASGCKRGTGVASYYESDFAHALPYPCPRGVDVRLSS